MLFAALSTFAPPVPPAPSIYGTRLMQAANSNAAWVVLGLAPTNAMQLTNVVTDASLITSASTTGNGIESSNSYTRLGLGFGMRNASMRTPMRGWNSFNVYGGNVGETNITAVADYFQTNGLIRRNWRWIQIDDGWMQASRSSGYMQPTTRFPNGMRALADRVHAQGVKLCIYLSPGASGTTPGGLGPVTTLADIDKDTSLVASWDIDHVRLDGSYGGIEQYYLERFARALDAAATSNRLTHGISLEYHMSQAPEVWMADGPNIIELMGDLTTWDSFVNDGIRSLSTNRWITRPGHFNSINGIVTYGQTGFAPTPEKLRSALTMMSMAQSAIMLGYGPYTSPSGFVPYYPDWYVAMLKCDGIELVADDPLCIAAWPIATNGTVETWIKPLVDGSWSVALWNTSTSATASASFYLTNLPGYTASPMRFTDLWNETNWYVTNGFSLTLNTNDVGWYVGAKTPAVYTTTNFVDSQTNTWTIVDGKVVSIGFQPPSISGLAYYWNFRDLKQGLKVSSWRDRIQSVILTNYVNNQPALDASGVRFVAGNTTYLTNTSFNVSSNYSLWVLYKQARNWSDPPPYAQVYGAFAGGASGGFYIKGAGATSATGSLNYFVSGDHVYTGALATNVWYSLVWANGTVYTNGTLVAAGGYTKPTDQPFDCMGVDVLGDPFDGWIQAVGIWTNKTLNASEAAALGRYQP